MSNASLFAAAAELEDNREHFVDAEGNPELFGARALYGPMALFIGLLLVAAILVAVYGPESWAALGALAIANGVLVLQYIQLRFYWNRALFSSATAD